MLEPQSLDIEQPLPSEVSATEGEATSSGEASIKDAQDTEKRAPAASYERWTNASDDLKSISQPPMEARVTNIDYVYDSRAGEGTWGVPYRPWTRPRPPGKYSAMIHPSTTAS